MVSPPIAFRCPHCGILLAISAQQAGTQGPCPRCAYEIRAPIPGMQPGFPAPYPSIGSIPQHNLAPQAPATPPQTIQAAPEKQATYASVPIAPRSVPSHAPARDNAPAPVHKEKLEPSGEPELSPQDEREPKSISRNILLRSLMPLPFLAAALVLIFGVMNSLKRQDTDSTSQPKPPVGAPADGKSPTGENPPTAHTQTIPSTSPTSTVPHNQLPPSAASDAIALLENFLNASSLEERLPFLETKTEQSVLQSSPLGASLPPFRNLLIESQKSYPLENIVDMYFSFEFINKDLSANPQTMVVRHRGGFPPRILADPFLDLYGGRLAAYAAKPQPKGQLFHVIATPLPSCNDLKIPDREKKLTLRLVSHENSEKVIHAYVSRVSKIGETISSGHYDLTYGKPQACVMLLGWNTEESPGAPYLEALDINSFHWNP